MLISRATPQKKLKPYQIAPANNLARFQFFGGFPLKATNDDCDLHVRLFSRNYALTLRAL